MGSLSTTHFFSKPFQFNSTIGQEIFHVFFQEQFIGTPPEKA
ncbi:hypothetical protein KR50_30240 [Jeotgalibacillus campisalis]|uniref:Uncharacterized protein n=1 Tax=Jeotgalibacillus campisalis TaxID=220754 RepID=A0A0C2RX72_9BACL|nr:hypothetical protein KR50_30240 [Jeotgalibacillus campisalis]